MFLSLNILLALTLERTRGSSGVPYLPALVPNLGRVSPVGEEAGFSTASIEKAKAAGLTFRPLAATTRDNLEYWNALPEDRRAQPRAGLAADKEAKVLAAWHSRKS